MCKELITDIYYDREYVSLYCNNNEVFEFKYTEGEKLFYNIAIKREINKIGNIEISDSYFDLETVYGYGGFYVNCQDNDFIAKAIKKYEEKCIEENIIAEFIRFHPFNNFSELHSNIFDFHLYDRDVVIKDLSSDVLQSYKSKIRNIIQRASEKVTIEVSKDIEKFITLYNATMKKNNADDFYFFNKKYYEKLVNRDDVELFAVKYQEEVVAMGFFLYGKEVAHYHLSANSVCSYSINANYALLHFAFNRAKEKGKRFILLGGGTTSDKDDSLFRFKKKFSQEIKPFYIAGKIYNKEIYEKYNNLWREQVDSDIKYFLKYRLEI